MIDSYDPTLSIFERSRSLDTLLSSLLALLDDYHSLREAASPVFADGFWDLGKAKYAIGPARCGRRMFDGRMKATVGVNIAADGKFDLASNLQMDANHVDADPKTDVHYQGLRQRSGEAQKSDIETIRPGELKLHSAPEILNGDGLATLVDPLLWFGVLVPPALRTSQTSFKNVLPRLVDLANMRARLIETADRYADEKKELEKQRAYCEAHVWKSVDSGVELDASFADKENVLSSEDSVDEGLISVK